MEPTDITIEILRGIQSTLVKIDGRLESIDGRLETVDGRLEGIERHAATTSARLELIADRLGFLVLETHISDLESRVEKLEGPDPT